jgi:hypothetical protein
MGTTVRLDWTPLIEPVASFLVEAGSASTLADLARLNNRQSGAVADRHERPQRRVFRPRASEIGPDGIPGPASKRNCRGRGRADLFYGSCGTNRGDGAGRGQSSDAVVERRQPAAAPATYLVEAGSAPALSNIVVFNTGNAATQLTANAPNGTYYVRLRGRTPPGSDLLRARSSSSPPGDSTTQGLDCHLYGVAGERVGRQRVARIPVNVNNVGVDVHVVGQTRLRIHQPDVGRVSHRTTRHRALQRRREQYRPEPFGKTVSISWSVAGKP